MERTFVCAYVDTTKGFALNHDKSAVLLFQSKAPCKENDFITKTKKMKMFSYNSDIFRISAQNIDCVYSLEPPRRCGSNEFPQSVFLSRNKKDNVYPCKPQFYYIKVGFTGVKIMYSACFPDVKKYIKSRVDQFCDISFLFFLSFSSVAFLYFGQYM